jgi:hypothetical protein
MLLLFHADLIHHPVYRRTTIGIGTRFNWRDELLWNHFSLAELFHDKGGFDDANAPIEQVKSHAVDYPYIMGHAMEMQVKVWYHQRRFDDATSETSCALEVHEKLELAEDVQECRVLLPMIKQATESGSNCTDSDCSELLEITQSSTPFDSPLSEYYFLTIRHFSRHFLS